MEKGIPLAWWQELTLGLLPVFVAVAIALWLQVSNWDVIWLRLFWDEPSQSWPYRDHWLASGILHTGGQQLTQWLAIILLVMWVGVSWRLTKTLRWTLTYVVVASISSSVLIVGLKEVTHLPCAWDVTAFGGKVPHLAMLDMFNPVWPRGSCFPAGHASGGYIWISLFFAVRAYTGRTQYWALLPGVLLGLVFGLTQQIRGAHFPSHDLVTFALCWLMSWLWSLWFIKRIYAAQAAGK